VQSVNRFTFEFAAPRVSGNAAFTVRFHAAFVEGVKTRDIAVTVRDALPEPVPVLRAPASWDGKTPLTLEAAVENSAAMAEKGVGEWQAEWAVGPMAVIFDKSPRKLVLLRALKSGDLKIRMSLKNGGEARQAEVTIHVGELVQDQWTPRVSTEDEQPEDGQFIARDGRGDGRLCFRGSVAGAADSVFLKLYADDRLVQVVEAKVPADGRYDLSAMMKAALISYRAEFGTRTGGVETVLRTVKDLMCGDAFLIDGQSNAEATAWGKEEFPETSPWIRTFGSMGNDPKSVRWGRAIRRGKGGQFTIGFWAYEMAQRLVEAEKIPICLINGAVGGTRIDQHQRNAAAPEDLTTIYGRMLWRVRQARLTHGIRGVLWHQGENDQGADGPSGGYGWETYHDLFLAMAGNWYRDFPNLQHITVFQIWPRSCAMGIRGSDNVLREIQRELPLAFGRMSLMSTLGIEPPGGCHYPPEGYAALAALVTPIIQREHYGRKFPTAITAPNLVRAAYVEGQGDRVALEFDQPVQWDDALAGQFLTDGVKGRIAAGEVSGNRLTLRLSEGPKIRAISYLDSAAWSQKTLLRGTNEIAALTFWAVPVQPPAVR
jgi:hypothetical protein